LRDEVLIEVNYHATVAKDAKVDAKVGISGVLCGLSVK
jgi:hypothetical protein